MFCRLCVYDCLSENAISLESEKMNKLIAKHLRLEILENNELHANIICNDCVHHLEDFDEFFSKIEKRQEVFNNLIQTKLEVLSNADTDSEKSTPESSTPNKEDDLGNFSSPIEEPMTVLEFTYATCDDKNDEFKIGLSETDDQEDDVLLSDIKVKDALATEANSNKTVRKTKVKKQREVKRKNSKQSAETANENHKKQAINMLTTQQKQRLNDLIVKYVTLQCELCHENMENFKEFQAHFQKSHGRRAYITCCGKHLNRPYLILDHLEIHANPEAFKCQICNKTLKTSRSLKYHEKLMHKRFELKSSCKICGKHFTYPSMLEKHMSVHDTTRNYSCSICDKRFKLEHALKVHVKQMHGERILHVCDICGKVYRFKLSFEQHVAEHQGPLEGKRQQCPICKVYVSVNYIKRHIQRHENVDAECDICGKKFTSIPVLRSHKERYHKKNQQTYDCTFCDKKFQKKSSLKEHIDMHTGNKEHSCKYCPREFRSKANMYAHVKKIHHELWAQAQQERYQNPDQTRSDCKNEIVKAIASSV